MTLDCTRQLPLRLWHGLGAAAPRHHDGVHGERRAAPRRIQLSQAAEDLIAADIRPATKKIYMSHAAKFDKYCGELGVDPSTCAVEVIANFLAGLPAATASTVAAQPAALLPAPAAVEAWAGEAS